MGSLSMPGTGRDIGHKAAYVSFAAGRTPVVTEPEREPVALFWQSDEWCAMSVSGPTEAGDRGHTLGSMRCALGPYLRVYPQRPITIATTGHAI